MTAPLSLPRRGSVPAWEREGHGDGKNTLRIMQTAHGPEGTDFIKTAGVLCVFFSYLLTWCAQCQRLAGNELAGRAGQGQESPEGGWTSRGPEEGWTSQELPHKVWLSPKEGWSSKGPGAATQSPAVPLGDQRTRSCHTGSGCHPEEGWTSKEPGEATQSLVVTLRRDGHPRSWERPHKVQLSPRGGMATHELGKVTQSLAVT